MHPKLKSAVVGIYARFSSEMQREASIEASALARTDPGVLARNDPPSMVAPSTSRWARRAASFVLYRSGTERRSRIRSRWRAPTLPTQPRRAEHTTRRPTRMKRTRPARRHRREPESLCSSWASRLPSLRSALRGLDSGLATAGALLSAASGCRAPHRESSAGQLVIVTARHGAGANRHGRRGRVPRIASAISIGGVGLF
jgi:hypothetical protein